MSKRKKKKTKVVEYSKLENKVAALWTRVSTERQEEHNCSLDTQKKICKEYAERNGIRIKREYGGTHESAKTEGEKYKAMITAVAADPEINVILVHSFDRFSRAGEEAIMTKAYLKAKGVYVISATQQTDPDSAAGTFMENILFLFNQFENSLRRDKAVTGMTECLRRGEWYGTPPLGYDHRKEGKHHIHTINAKGEILRHAFIWKAEENCSDVEIVLRLRALGLEINRKHLNMVLHNPFYCGLISHNLLGDEVIEGKQEKMIDRATFDKIQRITRAGYDQEKENEAYPLKRHIRCSDCGGYLTGYLVKKKGRTYYKCNKIGCKKNISTNKLHQLYADLLDTYTIPEPLRPILAGIVKDVFKTSGNEMAARKAVLKKRKTELERQVKDVKVRHGLGKIDDDVYTVTMRTLNSDLSDVERELLNCSQDLSNLAEFVDDVIETCCKLGTLWRDGDFGFRQKLQILVYPDGIFFDKKNGGYRTENENEVFGIFRRISSDYKEKTTSEISACRLESG